MITTPTTFVVGAGASKVYGLPASAGLRQDAHRLKPRDTAYKLIIEAGLCTREQLNTVLEDLRRHGTDSIDEYIYHRQDYPLAMKVGRSLIALLLGKHLCKVDPTHSLGAEQTDCAEQTDWLGYIIKQMRSGAPNCKAFVERNTQVRFVTFNFDSIIEDRLELAIRNIYIPSEADLREAVSAIHGQIIHVHGKLRPPPRHEFSCSYGWIEWLQSAQSEIRVVMDDVKCNILDDAQNAVKRSKILCFLGFAYARDNLEKLGLPKAHDRSVDGKHTHRRIYGTAFGMRPGETAQAVGRLVEDGIGGEEEHCFDYLRNHHIFRDKA